MPTSACPFRAQGERVDAAEPPVVCRAPGVRPARARRDRRRATTESATIAARFDEAYPRDYHACARVHGTRAPLQEQLVSKRGRCCSPRRRDDARAVDRVRQRRQSRAGACGAPRPRDGGAHGARRRAGRLLRQLVTESVMVSIAGGALGIGLAWLSLDLLVTFIGRFTSAHQQIGIDGAVLMFALGVSLFTGVIFGSAPAFSARRNLAHSMRDGGGAGRRERRTAAPPRRCWSSRRSRCRSCCSSARPCSCRASTGCQPCGWATRRDRVMTAAVFGNFSQTAEDTSASTPASSRSCARRRASWPPR